MQLAATLIISDTIESASLPDSLAEQSADVTHICTDSLGIDRVRTVIQQAHQKGMQDAGRSFVIATRAITVEAQNALLKLFEEPPTGAFLCLVIPHESLLLPTLRSRFISADDKTTKTISKEALAFMAAPYAERLDLIARGVKEKDSPWIEKVVAGVASSLDRNALTKQPQLARAVMLVEQFARIRGASKKMLLEELALTMPVTE